MKFLSLEVALYLYKSIIQPCMENCCHVWPQGSTNLIFAFTDFCACKMVLRACLCTQNYVSVKL